MWLLPCCHGISKWPLPTDGVQASVLPHEWLQLFLLGAAVTASSWQASATAEPLHYMDFTRAGVPLRQTGNCVVPGKTVRSLRRPYKNPKLFEIEALTAARQPIMGWEFITPGSSANPDKNTRSASLVGRLVLMA